MEMRIIDCWFTYFGESDKAYRSSGGKTIWREKLKMEITVVCRNSSMDNYLQVRQHIILYVQIKNVNNIQQ